MRKRAAEKNGNTFELAGEPIVFDPSKPDQIDSDGRKHWVVRTRIPFTLSLDTALWKKPAPATKPGEPSKRAEIINDPGEGPEETPIEEDKNVVVEGTASSTSVDCYGTEMSHECLIDMAEQFKAGVPYLPEHWMWEWHDVIGETFDAEVLPARVDNAADPEEPGYVVVVRTLLDMEEELAAKLARKLSAGKKIGQSIGAWFTEIRLISNEEGELERVIVEKTEQDHLAVTRRPANSDAWDSKLLSAVAASVRSMPECSLTCPWDVESVKARAERELAATRSADGAPAEPTDEEPIEAPEAPSEDASPAPAPEVPEAEASADPVDPTPAPAETESNESNLSAPDVPESENPTEASATEPTSPTTESDMEKELAEKLLSAITNLSSEVGALRAERSQPAKVETPPAEASAAAPAQAAPAEPDKSEEIRALEAKIDGLTNTLSRMAREPSRRALAGYQSGGTDEHGHVSRMGPGTAIRSAARSLNLHATNAVLDDEMVKRMDNGYADIKDAGQSRAQIESDLAAGVEAMLADGAITNPWA